MCGEPRNEARCIPATVLIQLLGIHSRPDRLSRVPARGGRAQPDRLARSTAELLTLEADQLRLQKRRALTLLGADLGAA